MRKETKTFEIYTFEELPTEVQNELIKKNRDINTFYEYWHDYLIEDFKEDDSIFNKTKVYYSGFWSQGDGAVFLYDRINQDFFYQFIEKECNFLTEKRKQLIINNVTAHAKNTHSFRYYHEKSSTHQVELETNETLNHHKHTNIINLLERIENIFEAYLIDTFENICIDFYRSLESHFNFLQEDEQVKETLISLEKEYLIDSTEY
jgi:hypothetical protein